MTSPTNDLLGIMEEYSKEPCMPLVSLIVVVIDGKL